MATKLRAARRIVLNAFVLGAVTATAHAANVSGNTYNPATSVILDGQYASFSSNDDYRIPGFMLGEEGGIRSQGLQLSEAELALSANIDDWFFGNLTTSLHPADGATEIEIEEAFIESTSLGNGFTLKAGKFFSGFGYLNDQHPHSWDFADTALVYRALVAGHIADDGLQLRWVAPTDLFLELGVEALRGAGSPSSGNEGNGAGARTLFVHLGGDIGTSNSWRVGLSRYSTTARDRVTDSGTFSGDVRVGGLDFVWKWAPDGNATQRNLKVQFEVLRRMEDGNVTAGEPGITTSYDGKQCGWYLQAAYQFMPQWRIAARYDHLKADNNVGDATVARDAGLDDEGHTPTRTSLAVDYSHSEYSRVRLQLNRDQSSPDANNQIFVQYVTSLGAHGAHKF